MLTDRFTRGGSRRPRRHHAVALAAVAALGAIGCTAIPASGLTPASLAPASGLTPATAVTPAPGVTPAPVVEGTFGIGPANAKGLDGRGVLNYTTQAGGHTTDRVAVHNYGARPLTVYVYAADAAAGGDGAIGYRPAADPGPDAGSWIHFGPGVKRVTLRLRPGATQLVPLSVTVPANASPGDHIAGVMAAIISKVVAKSGQRPDLEQRVALRAVFRISGDIRPVLSIDHLAVRYHGTLDPIATGSATVTYTVRNSGNANLGGPQRITITGLFGSTGSSTALARVPLLLPGATFAVRLRIAHIRPALLMRARVTVAPVASLGAMDPGLHATSVSVSFWAVPWTLLGALALLVALAVLWLVLRRSRGDGAGGSPRPRPTAPSPALAGQP